MIDEELTLFVDREILYQCPETIDEIRAGEISHKLRRLLLDKNSLMNFVNKKFGIKILFPTQNFSSVEVGNGITLYGVLELNGVKNFAQPGLVKPVKLDEYLKSIILEINNEKLSIKDVINLVANQLGGVHFDAIKAKEAINFDPRSKQNSLALRRAIVEIAKTVSIGLAKLASRCSPFPPYEDFIGHYDANPGVIDFEQQHWMEIKYPEHYQFSALAVTAVLELGPQEIPESVIFSMQDHDAEIFKLSFTPIGDAILDVRWADKDVRLVWSDEKRIRPIGKQIFVCALVKSIGNNIYLKLEVNGIVVSKIINVAAPEIKLHRAVLGANISGENGASFRLKEMCVLKRADDICINAIKKYSFYRYDIK